MIECVEVFETKGKQFRTLRAAIEYREELIVNFLRGLPGFTDMPAKSRLAFFEGILANRAHLSDLLDYREVTP
jgi:hypothetical protein